MRVLVLSSEPRPHGPWHTPARHAGCLTHWVQLHLGPEDVVIYPWMFVRGYVMIIEVQTGRRLREILEGNPMWMDETYKVHILEEEGPMSAKVEELPAVPGMNRFMILARLAKPVPPTVDFAGTDKLLAKMREQHGAQVYRLVEDVGGYAILVNVRDHDQLRELLEPLPITTFVNYQIIPLGTLEGHKKHLKDLGHNIPFEAPR
jgi:muconolactone delta-isomerase